MGDSQYDVNPMSLGQMGEYTRNELIGDRRRSLAMAGGLGTARGYSLGLNNPFASGRRAESDVYGQYSGALQSATGSNIDRAFGQLFQSKGAKFGRLAQLLGLQGQNIGNLSTGDWNEIVGPLLGGLIGAGGSIYGGHLAGRSNA
jgi:hypothetical protein